MVEDRLCLVAGSFVDQRVVRKDDFEWNFAGFLKTCLDTSTGRGC
jgi:hypothetical protein